MKLRDWSLRRWALMIAMIILLPLIGLRLHLKWRVHRAVAELRADGLPTTWEELESYFNVTPDEKNAGPKLTNIFRLLPDRSSSQSSNLPVVGLALTPSPGDAWPESMRAAARDYLASLQDGLSALYQALELPDCRYQRKFRPKVGEFTAPVWVYLRAATAKLSLECLFAIDQADWRRAARASEAQFRLADSLRAEPELIGLLVRNSLVTVAVDACQRLLGSEGAEPQILNSLQDTVRTMMSRTSLRQAILGERVAFLETIKPENELLQLIPNTKYGSHKWSVAWEKFKVMLYWMSGLADQDVLWFLAHLKKLETLLDGTLLDQQRIADAWVNFQPDSAGMHFCFWSKAATGSFDKAIASHLRMHDRLRATYAALSVAQYRLETI